MTDPWQEMKPDTEDARHGDWGTSGVSQPHTDSHQGTGSERDTPEGASDLPLSPPPSGE